MAVISTPVKQSTDVSAYVPPRVSGSFPRPVEVTSLGVPPIDFNAIESSREPVENSIQAGSSHAELTMERGDSPGSKFKLVNDESVIGRWDADNGIFPDVDLDAYDTDAKVSRRHAKIVRNNGAYYIEDLGSTNGTYVNRGRRLLPGSPQLLGDGDEVIVGKTFLRFHISRSN